MSGVFLSKSKFLNGLQCPKLLWYAIHKPSAFPEPGPAVQAAFDQGNQVGELARTLFPGGIKLEREHNPLAQSRKSLEAAKARKPLFEAGFVFGRAYALADILVPVAANRWDLIEVKSSTGVREEHLLDTAYQRWTYEGAGLSINNCSVMYLDREYVREEKLEPEKLLAQQDVTSQTLELVPQVIREAARLRQVLDQKQAPEIKIGPQCRTPHECPLMEMCWGFLPQEDGVFSLVSGTQKAFRWMGQGILSLAGLPEKAKLSPKQAIQVGCVRSKQPYADKKGIKIFLGGLAYPLYFLDFETMGLAIPPYSRSSPYENIPFQYSLFVVKEKGARPQGHAYLAPGDIDPRPEILKQLKSLLGAKGSIVAYNDAFEKGVLRDSAEAYPQYKNWAARTNKRMADLLEPFRRFLYYHPAQQGSASLKAVLPCLTSLSYEGMGIANGAVATSDYCRVTFGQTVDPRDKEAVRANLEKYCDLDTAGMIEIVEKLRELAG